MKPQIITNRDREPAFAVIPYDEYRALMERLEWFEDLRDSKAFEEKLAHREEEVVPAEVVGRLVEGESPVKVWREHRGLTQEDLGEKVGLSGSYLSQIESGKREGTVRVYAALARALGVDVDDLVAAGMTCGTHQEAAMDGAPKNSSLHRRILDTLMRRYDTPVMSNVYRADYVECSRTSAPQGRPLTLQREVPSPVSSRRSPFTLCRTKSRDCSPCSRLRKRT